MRKVEKMQVDYVGYKTPETADEVDLEILGLEMAIATAQARIALLRQGLHLNKMTTAATKTED